MSSAPTYDEVRNIAGKIDLPWKAFIAGAAQEAKSGETFATVDPATGKVLANIALCGRADVDAAVDAARRTFDAGVWSRLGAADRKAIMKRLAELIDANRLELAVLESLESGKPVIDCFNIDVPDTARTIEWFGEGIDKLYDQLSPVNSTGAGLIVREPIGVVAAVLPWNFPLMMLAWKLGPALATGNSVVVKPAEQTSMTALRVAQLALEAGIPAGVLNIVTGDGPTTGRAIGLHPDIGAVSFTGSTETGRHFLRYSAESNLKRIALECGGKNPAVILSDADPVHAARQSVFAAFWNMGQNCTANSRIIVHRKLKDIVLEAMISETKSWTTGDPLDPENRLGALVEDSHRDKVLTYIDAGRREKASLVYEGSIGTNAGGAFVAPTIFDGVTPEMTIAKEEIFGPVTGIMVADDDEQALAMANDTNYGLQASLYTRDVGKAYAYARRLQAGTISINGYSEGDITTPFGGFKQSGFGGRDKSIHAFDQYLEKKTVWLTFDS
jgi:gamma-glutamyl-gamma-aminobutyraldehyde dehydrogenase